jgi:hypothetical protein
LSQVTYFEKLERIFPEEFTEFTSNESFYNRLKKVIEDEVEDIPDDYLSSSLEEIESFNYKYNLNADHEVEKIKSRIDKIKDEADQSNYDWDAETETPSSLNEEDEDTIIKNMFASLNQGAPGHI